MHIYAFEKLDVWQLSRLFAKEIYEITNSFPSAEKYGLVSQIRRASVSISSNIAEGSARGTFKDQAHFYQMSYGSLIEVLNQLIFATDLNFINDEILQKLRYQIDAIANKLNALRNACLKKSLTV